MTLSYFFGFYFATGFLFAIWFSFFKVKKIDDGAAGTSVWFKLIIMPASILLWPLVWKKLFSKK